MSCLATIERLKDKRLGYSGYGAVTHFAALSFAKILDWNPDRDLSLMSPANTTDAFKSGRVDALIAGELYETMALAAGYKILRANRFIPRCCTEYRVMLQ